MFIFWFAIVPGIFFLGIAAIVYFAISYAYKKNGEYAAFAKAHQFSLQRAMGRDRYRGYSSHTQQLTFDLPLFKSPFVDKYANFKSFPFGRGTGKLVAYIIEGEYREKTFRAFAYRFTGTVLDHSFGGVYGIVMMKTGREFRDLPENTFAEDGYLCHYDKGNLDVKSIFPTLDGLIELEEGVSYGN